MPHPLHWRNDATGALELDEFVRAIAPQHQAVRNPGARRNEFDGHAAEGFDAVN